MEFSVVEIGYDRNQVDSCLEDLAEQLARMVARTDAAAGDSEELASVRQEAVRLRDLLETARPQTYGPSYRMRRLLALAEEEAAGIVVRARAELAAAQEEARQVRDRVYAEALQARRDFEAALHARRLRAQQVDEILREVRVSPISVDHTASNGVGERDEGGLAAAPEQPQSGSPRVADRSTAQV